MIVIRVCRGKLSMAKTVNVLGPLALVRHVMPVMRSRRTGVIINVSSIGGRMAAPFASLYHASKFAIEGFSESFRYEAAVHGIRVRGSMAPTTRSSGTTWSG